MQQQENKLNDDWTRNWQARVAIKITAIFLWIIILSGFGAVIYFTQDLEEDIQAGVSRDLDSLAYQVRSRLDIARQEHHDLQGDELAHLVEEILLAKREGIFDHSGIMGVRLTVGEVLVEVGNISDEFRAETRPLVYADPGASETEVARLEGFYLETKKNAVATRQQLIVSVVIVLLLFGMMLSFTIQQVLSKPFNVLMNAIQGVSNGDLDTRLDVTREDEFGHLSRFFNQMLDRVQVQQKELTEANKDLINEIAVRKQAEQKLRANQDELEKLVEERTRDLAIARDQALEASQTKSAFIANVSHEIRTPLTPIIGFAEALLHGNENEQDREQLLRTIIRNGKHLSRIINEILDLSKIEANSLDTESIPVNIFEVLDDVRSIAEMLVREKGLSFEIQHQFPMPASICSDPTRIKQILMNLVTNAIKFTEKGRVTIVTRYLEDEQQIELAIIDTGIGIPKEKVGKLFKPFSQADYSTTRQFGGTGLGLYISKRLALLLGGDIILESVDGVGTRSVVRLSIGGVIPPQLVHTTPSVQQDEKSVLNREDEVRLRGEILLAEDSPDIQRLMTYILGRMGLSVTAVENGAHAVEAALAHEFQLILMDMQMPVMSGIEAVELLRASGCSTPIVALTANAMKEDRLRYKEVGCDDFLSKPVDQDKLRQVLCNYLAQNDAMTENAEEATDENEHDQEFQGLVESFLDGLDAYAKRISAGLDENNFDTVRELAHQLKGMGGSFGFPEITRQAAALESAIKADELANAAETGRSFVLALETIGEKSLSQEVG